VCKIYFCRRRGEIKRHNIQNIIWKMNLEQTGPQRLPREKAKSDRGENDIRKRKERLPKTREGAINETEMERAAKHRRSDRMAKHRNEEGATDEERVTEETRG
jgi:hypothetical protein